ncbi:hypothetical protein [Brevibacillus laterosporus]|uniref:hypothetical protein n=1 Tax=Brevibacillus laterosporus TaxID=1465 RepID=UPI003D1BD942
MQRTTRTNNTQPNRSTLSQTNRMASSQTRVTNTQGNRGTNGQTRTSTTRQPSPQQAAPQQKRPVKNQPKDRLGQAIVSMIFGIFGIILFVMSCFMLNYSSRYYTPSPGTMLTIFLAFIINASGFILGIRARNSTNGRGMAIAGITLTSFPFVIMTLFFVATIIGTFSMWM